MLFARFMAIYGHKFKSCFETQDEIRIAKREWALSVQGYSESQLVAAIDQCKETLEWMPSIAEFLRLLDEMGEQGIPAVLAAYQEACRYADRPTQHGWSHPVVYHAGRETGWFELRSLAGAAIFKRFSYNFQQVKARFKRGDALDLPVAAGLEDQSEASLYRFIQHWSESQPLSHEQASSLLYYLTKPAGSRARALYQQRAQAWLEAHGLSISLPDQADLTALK